MSNISLVIEREYRSRVAKKSFIFTTLLMPVLMLALMCAPAAVMVFAGPEDVAVMVVDNSGQIAPALEDTDEVRFTDCGTAAVEDIQQANQGAPVLLIPANVLENRNARLKLFCDGPATMAVESAINHQVNNIIEKKRLADAGVKDLDRLLSEAKSDLRVQTIRTDREDETVSSELSYALGMLLTLVLYMFMLLYGQMVMTSIIEEKNNRVLEVVVSSVKPVNIMMGKIVGMALVALTQLVIWGVLLFMMTAFLLPAILPEAFLNDIAAMQSGNAAAVSAAADMELLEAFSRLTDLGYMASVFGIMTLFLIGGFFFYSAIYAAIGSAVDNIQDASQLQSVIIFPVIIGLICSMAVAANPSTPMAFWLSMIPFTSPMVMMARLPFGIPAWETALSFAILALSFVAMTWIAAKIYRVGIFMYGKKPTFKDLVRWINYK